MTLLPADVEREMRRVLAALPEYGELSTKALVDKILPALPEDTLTQDVYRMVDKLGSRALCRTEADTRMVKGVEKTIQRKIWKRITSAGMPDRPYRSVSQGAASPGHSLQAELAAIMERLEQIETLLHPDGSMGQWSEEVDRRLAKLEALIYAADVCQTDLI